MVRKVYNPLLLPKNYRVLFVEGVLIKLIITCLMVYYFCYALSTQLGFDFHLTNILLRNFDSNITRITKRSEEHDQDQIQMDICFDPSSWKINSARATRTNHVWNLY